MLPINEVVCRSILISLLGSLSAGIRVAVNATEVPTETIVRCTPDE